jgi:hypothetical protein
LIQWTYKKRKKKKK